MGIDFDALLFYGMVIDGDVDYDWLDEFNESNDRLEITNLSPMSDSNYVLFVRESYQSGDKYEDEKLVRLSDLSGKEDEWQQLIKDACAAHEIQYSPPDWYFATMFS